MSHLNLNTPINSLGYGQVGRGLLKSLSNDINISLFPIGPIDIEEDENSLIELCLNNSLEFNPKAPCFKLYHPFEFANRIGKGKYAGYTFFELNKLNKREVNNLNSLDILFVPSNWAKEVCINSGVSTQIEILNPGINEILLDKKDRCIITSEKPNPTVFLHIGKWMLNKGSDIILDAFNQAFEVNDNVLLIMCSFNPIKLNSFDGPLESQKWEYTYLNSKLGKAQKINIIRDRFKSQKQIYSIIEASDCGLYPARCEGWNLGLCESLAMGKHCIATNYSAHTEYLEKSGCLPINIDKLEPCYEPPFFLPENGEWAYIGQNQIDQLVNHMRNIHRIKQENGKLPFNYSGLELFTNHITWKNASNKIKNILDI